MSPEPSRWRGSTYHSSSKFKQTDLGFLPADWDIRMLEDIGSCLIGLTYDPKYIHYDGVLVLRSSNIGENSLQFEDNTYVKMRIPDRKIACEDDLLICVRNGSRALIGKCALIKDSAVGMTFGAFMSVFRSPDSRYAFYCFQSDIIKNQIHQHLGATINQITNKSLNGFKIPYPKTEEREAIAEALSDVDSLLSGLEALIAKKRDIKRAVMQQLLTGKTRLPGFSRAWRTIRLGDICMFLPTANNSRADLSEDGDVHYIHYGDVHAYARPVMDCASSNLPRILRNRVGNAAELADGDLVMVDASEDLPGVGKSIEVQGVLGRTIVAGLHTILCRGNQDAWAMGFKAYLQYLPAFKSALARVTSGTSVYAISKKQLADIILQLPTLREQEAIVSVLSDMDSEIAALERHKNKTHAIKQGMMQELLTGRVRLVNPDVVAEASPC